MQFSKLTDTLQIRINPWASLTIGFRIGWEEVPLRRSVQGDSVLAGGLFRVRDAAGNTGEAMFVVREISEFFLAMEWTQRVLVIVTIAALGLGTLLVLTLLTHRVVGGDYKSEIRVSSDDEVGQFERLFE
jgi:hypothetical protein